MIAISQIQVYLLHISNLQNVWLGGAINLTELSIEPGKDILLLGIKCCHLFFPPRSRKTMLRLLNSIELLKKPLDTIQGIDTANTRKETFLVHIISSTIEYIAHKTQW